MKGAEVIFQDVHVSGHACQEEIKLIYTLVHPKYAIPVHGEYKHLVKHAEIAKSMGMPEENILICSIGDVIETDGQSMRVVSQVPAGRVMVDGLGVGDVGSIVLRDRKHLAQDGLIIVVIGIERMSNSLVAGPDIISRGFVYMKESEELMNDLKSIAFDSLSDSLDAGLRDFTQIKGRLKDDLSKAIYQRTKRKPMVLPVIMNI